MAGSRGSRGSGPGANGIFPSVSLSELEALKARQLERSFLQAHFWAEFKAKFGWKPFAVDVGGQTILVLVRAVFRVLRFVYVPHGPDLIWLRNIAVDAGMKIGDAIVFLSRAIVRILPNTCFFVRWDPDWIVASRPAISGNGEDGGAGEESPGASIGSDEPEAGKAVNPDNTTFLLLAGDIMDSFAGSLIKAPADVQPANTVLLDISRAENEILTSMKSKTRYNVRLAAKKGVTVSSAGVESLAEWYVLYKETAARDRIAVHSFTYYEELFRHNRENIDLLLARHENDLLAGIIVLYWGKRATYLYGASSNLKRNLMPAYALQWQAILSAKARGCESYDFFGLPAQADPAHPMFGLYQFKTGFGGELVTYPGSWDFPINRVLYALMGIAEGLRHFYFKRLKKR